MIVENVIFYFALPVISLSLLLIFIRMITGPSTADRIVAFDLMTVAAISALSLYAIISGSERIIDVGIIIALLAFLGTVAYAYFIEKRGSND